MVTIAFTLLLVRSETSGSPGGQMLLSDFSSRESVKKHLMSRSI